MVKIKPKRRQKNVKKTDRTFARFRYGLKSAVKFLIVFLRLFGFNCRPGVDDRFH